MTLHVLNEPEVMEAYKAHTGWNEFTIVGDLTRRVDGISLPAAATPAAVSSTRKILDAHGRIIIIAPDGSRYSPLGLRLQ